jgi:hypothetical protein
MQIKIVQLRKIIKEEVSRVMSEGAGGFVIPPDMIDKSSNTAKNTSVFFDQLVRNCEVVGKDPKKVAAFEDLLSRYPLDSAGSNKVQEFSMVPELGYAVSLFSNATKLTKFGIDVGSFADIEAVVEQNADSPDMEEARQEAHAMGRQAARVYPPGSSRD